MAKIIITAIGSAGDVLPMIGVGRALLGREHQVLFCTHPQFEAQVQRSGFTFVPIGTAEHYARTMADPALWRPRTSFKTLWRAIAPFLEAHFDTLMGLVDSETVLVGTLWAFSARLVQELHATPFVSVQISPSTLLSAHAPPVHKRLVLPRGLPLAVKSGIITLIERLLLDRECGPQLNAVRASLGLAPVTRILGRWMHSPDGVLCLFPDWFAQPQPDWPERHLQTSFPLFTDAEDSSVDADLNAFIAQGPPPVVFTAGSTHVDAAGYAGAVMEALRTTGARGLLLMPHAQASMADAAMPGVLVRRYLPLRTLLPRCRALVHHGGIGTAALAYEAGIPQVVTPFAHDQFDSAQRIADSGCGVRLDAPVRGAALGRALGHVLDNAGMAERCTQIRSRMAVAPDGCAEAARFIERFVPGPLVQRGSPQHANSNT